MAKASKVSVAFSSDPAGLERGIQRANAAMRSLKASSSGLEKQMESLKRAVSFNSMIQAFSGLSQVARSVATDFSGMWRNSAASIDQLAKLGDASGRTFREMKALQLAGELAGTSVETLSKALGKADLAFFDASQGSASAVAAFKNIGLGVEQLAGLNSSQRFEKIADAIARLPDPATRAAASMRLLGEEALGLQSFFEGGSEAMRDASDYIERMGLGLTELEAGNVERMNDAFTRGSLLIGGIVDKITAGLSPAITKVVDKFGELVQKAGGAGGLGDAIVDSIFEGLELIAPTSDALVTSFRDMWADAELMMKDVLSELKLVVAGAQKVQGVTGLVTRSFSNFGGFLLQVGGKFGEVNQQAKLWVAEAAGIDFLKEDALKRLEQLRAEEAKVAQEQARAIELNKENLRLIFGGEKDAVEGAARGASTVMQDAVAKLKEAMLQARKDAEQIEQVNNKIAGGDFGQLFAGSVADFVRQAGGVFADATERAKAVIGAVGGEAANVVQKAGREMSLVVGSREASNYVARLLSNTADPEMRIQKDQLAVQEAIRDGINALGIPAIAIN